ncbi:MAG TPA: 30S ribosomal protein S20 [Rectinema sp.]|nr:30S ribosomal protein S20 [Rectinema sp.]HOU06566.1 30S ribosomal protein S20 [Rectinema sp.]HOW11462.1 30S ribosomal protein S20 [Rectinema sp.]HPL71047.1 30S ribosomal protein S20 [Rectinema sp.]HQE68451.1 30S ribosomal protein S20 [Rectinema sp.]
MSTSNLSAEKRQRQNEKRRLANKSTKTSIKSAARKVVIASEKKDAAAAKEALSEMIKRIDSAARKGIVKKNTAARKKSRMQRLVNKIDQ